MLTIINFRMVVNTIQKIDNILEQDIRNPEIQVIKAAMKQTKDKRMYQRYIAVYLHFKGYTNRDIAKEEGFCEHTVGTYISKYNKKGLDGFSPKPNLGTPQLLTPEQEKFKQELELSKKPS